MEIYNRKSQKNKILKFCKKKLKKNEILIEFQQKNSKNKKKRGKKSQKYQKNGENPIEKWEI